MTRSYSNVRRSALRVVRPALACLLTLLLPTLACAATLNVPSQYPTIQAGVNAAVSGDTVLVADGTYSGPGNRDIDFNGKSLTVTSLHGAASTIIDCGGFASSDGSGNHRGFYIHRGELAATISGFTVKNGYEFFLSSTNDLGNGTGGGVCIINTANGTTALTGCTILGNTAGYGGGVCNIGGNGSTATLTNCAVSGNTATQGGGVRNIGGTVILAGCTVSGNVAVYIGGGICNDNNGTSMLMLTGCTVSGNTATQGGGVWNESGGMIMLTSCTVSGNTATQGDGGGIYNHNIMFSVGTTTLTNCTVSGNIAKGNGGGVYNINNNHSPLTLTNCVLYLDSGGEIINGPNSIGSAIATYSDIQGGYSGTGNIYKDPLFVNAAYGDLHLKSGSPCIGAGTATGAPATDKDDNLRLNPPSMGAYEGVGHGVVIQRPVGSLTLYDAGYDFAHTDLSDSAVASVNVPALAGDTQVCTGAVTDGATKVLLRYNASAAGTVTFTETEGVKGDNLRPTFGSNLFNQPVTVTTQVINGQNVAFAVYTVPESLDGTPEAKANPAHSARHIVNFQVTFTPGDGTASTASAPLTLESPPVLLVHGRKSSAQAAWGTQAGTATALIHAGYRIFLVDYADTSNSHLSVNQLVLLNNHRGILDVYNVYHAEGIAITKVDVVAHSMGGLLTREFAGWSGYSSVKNFHAGYVRRLITLGTPHFGSAVATIETNLCSGPEILLAPNRAFARALFSKTPLAFGDAVIDLQPGSPALAALLATTNRPVAAIPSFAVAGDFSGTKPGDLLGAAADVFNFFGRPIDSIFGGESNDFVVGESSADGGLPNGNTNLFANTDHLQETSSEAIAANVVQLLSGPLMNFDRAGFMSVGAAVPRLSSKTRVPRDAQIVPSFITVTAPAAGQVFHVGDTLTVSLRPNAGTTLAQALVQAGSSPRDVGSALLSQSPYTATFTVPVNALGVVPVAVTAKDNVGNVCTVTVNIAVQTNAALSSMTAAARATAPSGAALLTSQGSTTPLTVTGTFSDATQADITASALGTTYTSSDPTVATVSAEGILAAQADGNCTITVTNGTVTVTENVIVQLGTPTILSVTPASGTAGTTVSLTLVGSDLGGASKVQFYLNGAPDPNITATNLQATPQGDGLTATITLTPGAAAGLRTVVVTTPGGLSDTLAAPDAAGFTVTPAFSGGSHVLWTNTDGTASLWSYDLAGGTFTQNAYGPYPGWSAKAVADGGTDGKTRLLWNNTNGAMSLWSLDNSTGQFTQNTFGPYPGWTAKTVSVGPDNTTHILWASTSGAASVWNYSTDTGGFTQHTYGPYPGWVPVALADGANGKTRMIWGNYDGRESFWNLDSGSGSFTQNTFGPYPGWTANALSVSADGVTHIMWDDSTGQMSLWNYDPVSGGFTQHTSGPYSGWTAIGLADGADGKTRLLWTNGAIASLWNYNAAASSFTQFTFGPYAGWSATAVSAP